MFRKTNEEINLEGLDDFIEKPSQNFEEEDLKKGVDKVIFILDKNPSIIMDIINNHPYIPATFLLDDLAEKMKKTGCLEKLELLFNKCPDELVEACIYNLHDLGRCFNALPACSDEIMKLLLSNENYINRIRENDKNPEEALEEISKKYPNYKDQFSECYNKCFKTTLAL